MTIGDKIVGEHVPTGPVSVRNALAKAINVAIVEATVRALRDEASFWLSLDVPTRQDILRLGLEHWLENRAATRQWSGDYAEDAGGRTQGGTR